MQNYLTSPGCCSLRVYSKFPGFLYIQAFDLLEMLKKEEEMLSSIKEIQEKVRSYIPDFMLFMSFALSLIGAMICQIDELSFMFSS